MTESEFDELQARVTRSARTHIGRVAAGAGEARAALVAKLLEEMTRERLAKLVGEAVARVSGEALA
jgi:hypothetical protein